MIRGLYTAGAGMIAQQRRQEMLTNNLANANTPGYKADQASLRAFPNQLLKAIGTDHLQKYGTNRIGELTTGVYMQERTPNYSQGDIHETNNNTDIALLQGVVPLDDETGETAMLAYNVQNNDGEARYTRNGNLTIDGEGFLTTSQGYYVLSTDNEPINVGSDDFRVRDNGEVLNAAEDVIAQIDVSVIQDPAQLVKEGSGLLRYDGENEVVSAVDNEDVTYKLQQGFVERSNVDTSQTMTEMMSTMRSFEANQQVLKAYDRSLEIAVNQIGKLR